MSGSEQTPPPLISEPYCLYIVAVIRGGVDVDADGRDFGQVLPAGSSRMGEKLLCESASMSRVACHGARMAAKLATLLPMSEGLPAFDTQVKSPLLVSSISRWTSPSVQVGVRSESGNLRERPGRCACSGRAPEHRASAGCLPFGLFIDGYSVSKLR